MSNIFEILFEILFEIIIEGSFELTTYKKVPLIIRIIAGVIVFAVYGGLIGVCLFWGFKNSQVVLILLAIVILLLSSLAVFRKYKEKRTRQIRDCRKNESNVSGK